MKYVFSISLLCFYLSVFSQDTVHTARWRYYGLHGGGLVAGSSQQSLSLLTTNGITKNNWYVGLATGIDWYGVRSIPVLASLHKAFGKNNNQPFVYGNAGMSCPWEQSNYSITEAKYHNSFMGELGVGYFVFLKNKTAFTLSVGYSYKTTKQKGKYTKDIYHYYGPSYYSSNFEDINHYRRIAIRLGIKI